MWRGAILVVILVLTGTIVGSVGPAGSAPSPAAAATAPVHGTPTATSPRSAPPPTSGTGLGERSDPESNVTFLESGLPAHTDWEVSAEPYGSLFESYNTSTSPDVNETLPDGVYNFSAEANLPDYAAYGTAVSFSLTGPNASVPVRFWLGYHLTFDSVGLPSNVSWNVSLTAEGLAQNRIVAGDGTEFWIPEGNYSYVDSSSGYAPSPADGSGQLSGNATISLDFARLPVPPGVLAVTLNAASADFYLNGVLHRDVPTGTSSFTLAPGLWIVFVTSPGYLAYYNTTQVRSNQTVPMDVALQPVPSNPSAPLLSASADVIVICLGAGVAIMVVLFVVASRRLSGR